MDRIQLRRDSSARWAEINPILLEGEVGFETDTKRRKIGDGTNRWNDLDYLAAENVVQELGNSENVVISQKGVTEKFTELETEVLLNKEILNSIFTPIEFDDDSYLNSYGYQVPYDGAKSTSEFYSLQGVEYLYSGVISNAVAAICFYSEKDRTTCVGSYVFAEGKLFENVPISEIVSIPSNARYVRFSSFTSGSYGVQAVNFDYLKSAIIANIKNIQDNSDDIEKLWLEAGVLSERITAISEIANKEIQNGYYNANYYFVAGNGYSIRTDAIPCKGGDVFMYRGIGGSSYPSVFFFNEKPQGDKVISSLAIDSYDEYTQVVVPEGINYAVFCSWTSQEDAVILEVYGLQGWNKILENKVSELQKDKSNILYGKTYVACGDSFTKGYFDGYVDTNGKEGKLSDAWDAEAEEFDWTGSRWQLNKGGWKTYAHWIAKRNNMIYYNGAISGSTLANGDNSYVPFAGNRYINLPSDADYITIWFGINDSGRNIPLGSIDDSNNDTFYGAWNVVLEYLITNHPLAKIGIIVTNYAPRSFRQATIECARKWGISYLDIMGDDKVPLINGGKDESIALSALAKGKRDEEFCINPTSNIHPNPKCHLFESTFIEEWMRTL